MRNLSLIVCLLIIVSITLLGCGADNEANNNEDNLGKTETQNSFEEENNKDRSSDENFEHDADGESDEEKQYDSEIEEIRDEGRAELGIEEIFIPEMKELKIGNAFVSYSYKTDEPMQIDVQYHVERGEKQEQFENQIVVEEKKEETGMKFLIPPYVNNGDMSLWFVFSKMDIPKMFNNEGDGIEEEWIEIDGNQVLFANNGTEYRYYVDDENGHYMFGYTLEQYSKDESKEITGDFIKRIESKQYN
ncbi:hypothetical protein [Bacillus sp. B15-48]|uniref:hypothetical protein n=1 Tax=Bacillus sp. B15-48 TaxID=1548601 RepID=UPI00193F0937|nr:hypothetical protein [Bacillus sp. B15-48]MBM4763003.1 hypothetical protein [Bacillus sp. B15-48]